MQLSKSFFTFMIRATLGGMSLAAFAQAPAATPTRPVAAAKPSVPTTTALYLALLQFLFNLCWVVYAIYLPKLAAEVGIAPSAVIFILMLDQAIFTITDTAMGIAADRVAKLVGYRSGNLDGVGEILRHRPPCQRARWRVDEERIARQPGLAECRNGGPHRSRLADQPAGLFGRGFAVERDGELLDQKIVTRAAKLTAAQHGELGMTNASVLKIAAYECARLGIVPGATSATLQSQ